MAVMTLEMNFLLVLLGSMTLWTVYGYAEVSTYVALREGENNERKTLDRTALSSFSSAELIETLMSAKIINF